MVFLKNLTIRTKSLLVPAIMAGGMILLGGLSLQVLDSQKTLLVQVVYQDLAKIDTLSVLFSQLSTTHVQIFDLLASAGAGLDEEKVYESGKRNLDILHDVMSQVNEITKTVNITEENKKIHSNLTEESTRYHDTTITAIEMASVDLKLATRHMIVANQSYSKVNMYFLSLMNNARNNSNSAIAKVLAEFDNQRVQFTSLLWPTIVMAFITAVIISTLLSREIMYMTRIITKLAMGDTSVDIPHLSRKDEIGIMAYALQIFKQSLIQLADAEMNATKLNHKLEEEIRERKQAQEALGRTNEELEMRVEERTTRLVQANAEISTLNQRLTTDNLRMSAELDLLRQMQQLVLPTAEELAAIDNLDIAAFMEPADEVGGDYYDVLQTDGIVTIGIGDVTGHGLESGILMVMTQAAVRALKETREADPVRFLDTLNRTLYQNVQRMHSDKNLTLALLTYMPGCVSISGQHEEIVIVRRGGISNVSTQWI